MTRRVSAASTVYRASPRLWRLLLVAAATLILCSCRGPMPAGAPMGEPVSNSPALPQEAYTGVTPGVGPAAFCPPGMEQGVPLPIGAPGPWTPPGMSQPWPPDEYVCDGGDKGHTTVVGSQWNVRGLDPEDTVAHFDTLDGRRLVEPSNRVCIYSPRFGAVRQVVSLQQDERMQGLGDVNMPTKLVQHEEVLGPQSRQQRIQPEGELGLDLANTYRSQQGEGAVSTAFGLKAVNNDFKPFENLAAIRQGTFEVPEMPRLAQSVAAALVWEHKQAVQVVLDHQNAVAEVGVEKLSEIHTVKSPHGESKLRITKVASTGSAKPGEEVDFTLRFDNVGTELIGNVTILDNLTARLEYVAGTAQCSLPAEFFTEPSQSDSLVLRWEITDPLKPGAGGIIRFRCRVR